MNFPIEIRHIETGLARTFASLQEIADFLVGKVEAEWEGWRHMGALPAPTVTAEPVAEAALSEPAPADSVPADAAQPPTEPYPEPTPAPVETLVDKIEHGIEQVVEEVEHFVLPDSE